MLWQAVWGVGGMCHVTWTWRGRGRAGRPLALTATCSRGLSGEEGLFPHARPSPLLPPFIALIRQTGHCALVWLAWLTQPRQGSLTAAFGPGGVGVRLPRSQV